jgi:hypothetical protein
MKFHWFFFIINVYQLWEHLLKQIVNDKSNHLNSKFLKINGQYLCKIVYDHCILCLQETHHHYKTYSRHKFQMCKEDGFINFKFDYTWQHDLLTKLGFIKFGSPKHVIFERSCKLHHYKLSMVAFNNIL